MQKSIHVGIDIGTTNITIVGFDIIEQKIVDYRSLPTGRVATGESYSYAQDPHEIEAKVRTLLGSIDYTIASICVTGQVHGILYYDEHGCAISPLYTWLDQRGMVEIDGFTSQDYLFEMTGTKLPSGYGFLTHFANRRMGKIPSDAVGFCGILEYITGRLIGRPIQSSDPSCLGTYGAFNAESSTFAPEVLRAILDDNIASFLRASGPFTIAGYLPDGIPIAYPVGDNQAGFFGMVPDWSSSALVSMGTSGQISLFSSKSDCPSSMELRPFMGQGYLQVGATLTAGKSYEILEKLFASVITECGFPVDDEMVFSMMRRLPSLSPEDSLLSIDSRFAGTRKDPLVRGSISGIGLDNLTIGNLVYGTVRAIIGELHDFVVESKSQIESLVAIGSSVRHNELFTRELERKFGVVPVVPDVADGAGFGAALIGAVAVGAIALTDVSAIVGTIAYGK